MTKNQEKILFFCIKEITGISPDDPSGIIKLKHWLIDKNLKLVETSMRASFGNMVYTFELANDQLTLYQSSNYLPEAAFIECVGKYCKDEFIKKHM